MIRAHDPPATRSAVMTRAFGKHDLLLGFLFLTAVSFRLWAVYPPRLEYDPATVALQACQILAGERPIFWSGQSYMGASGAYLVAALFAVFGKSTLLLSVLAWALSALWMLFSLLLARRFFGSMAAVLTALIWIVPTRTMMYWAATARTDRLISFALVPLLLLVTHGVVSAHRAGARITGKALLLGLLSGFAFWHNMIIAPCLAVSIAVLAGHLRADFWRRFLVPYALAGLAGAAPLVLYLAQKGFVLGQQLSRTSGSRLTAIVRALATKAFPTFWGFGGATAPGPVWRVAEVVVLAWLVLLALLLAKDLTRRWRAGEDLLAEQLTVGYAAAHLAVFSLSTFGKSVLDRNPLLYLYVLYGVAFALPAAVLARGSRYLRIAAVLPFLAYAAHNLAGTLSYPRDFLSAARSRGWAAVQTFPDPHNALATHLAGTGLRRGYAEERLVKSLNLAGLDEVEAAHPYNEEYLPYSLGADAAGEIFWLRQSQDLADAFRALGSSFRTERIGRVTIYRDFNRPAPTETLVAAQELRAVSPDGEPPSALTDGRIDTNWGGRRASSATVTVELTREERLSRVTLLPESYRSLPPRILVESSSDGSSWETRASVEQANVFFWSVRHPFLKIVLPRCEVALSQASPAKFLRLTLTGEGRPWRLSEIFLYRTDREEDAGVIAAASAGDDVEAVLREVAPLRGARLMVGDHYFMSLLRTRGFEVAFVPNQRVDNEGGRNPALDAPLAVDFGRALCLIVPASHGASVARTLAEAGIASETRRTSRHLLFLTRPCKPRVRLVWCGIDLLRLGAPGG